MYHNTNILKLNIKADLRWGHHLIVLITADIGNIICYIGISVFKQQGSIQLSCALWIFRQMNVSVGTGGAHAPLFLYVQSHWNIASRSKESSLHM